MQQILKLITYCLFSVTLLPFTSCNQVQKAEAHKTNLAPIAEPLLISKVVISNTDTTTLEFVNGHSVFSEGWDTLKQAQFWKQIMCLSPDSCIINVAKTRDPLQRACYRTWNSQTEIQKSITKSKLIDEHCIDFGEELYVTNGKKEFYEHRKSIPVIAKAVSYFKEYGVDPWYAQTILLIESPGKHLSKSYAGAGGPFQLMKSVAVKYGLKVNKYVDERSDLHRAAYGASRLLSTICIPKVKGMLDSRNISYQETDIWFRLLVLHAYHAGAGNLACAINKINPTEGGQQLIKTLWKTECGGFKNESQNYSQIALAATLNFEDILRLDGDTVFMIQGDKVLSGIERNTALNAEERNEGLLFCLLMYERDLIDGTISFDYYKNQVDKLRANDDKRASSATDFTVKYPLNDEQLVRVSTELFRKRKMEDAIRLLRINMDYFPSSSLTAEQLSKAYRLSGDIGLSQKYLSKSNELGKMQ